jgi:TraG P-loop domain
MLPIADKIEHVNTYHVFTTTDGVVGLGLKLKACDVESEDEEAYADKLSNLFRTLNPNLRIRFLCSSQTSRAGLNSFPRRNAFEQIAYRETELLCIIERSTSNAFSGLVIPGLKHKKRISAGFDLLLDAARSMKDIGFQTTPLSEEETRALFIQDIAAWTADIGSVETGTDSIGVIRLVKPSAREVTLRTLASVLKEIAHDFEIRVCLERLSATQSEMFLQRRLKQVSQNSKVGEVQSESLEDTLVSTSLSGESLLNYEFLVVLRKPTKAILRSALSETAACLKPLGDFEIETLGCAASLVCSYPGSKLHVPVLEQEKTLPCFIPVFREGTTSAFNGESKRAVTFQRMDGTLSHIDLLDTKHQNQNAVIIGTSGKGKSVALGVLTHSLLQDENVSILKVDVGGSHSRECSMLGGVEYKLRIDQPSGLNPFALLSGSSEGSEFERSVIGQFLEVLILEEGERRLSKALRADLDRALENYLSKKHKSSSLDEFVKSADAKLPRRELFDRWVGTGLYSNAFRDLPDRKKSESGIANSKSSDAAFSVVSADREFASTRELQATQLKYFNFSEVFQASDPEFSQAVMAAVLAVFNLEMKRSPEKRLVLVCDETPFFIEKCFEFFKFSTANVRKFGASVVLVVQLSKHLVVGGDTGVVENSSHRFLFSSDGTDEDFKARLHLNDEQFERIKSLKPKRGESQLVYQHHEAAQTLSLRLTQEEYWRLTSTQSDRIKIDSLLKAVPQLSTAEAIQVLAFASSAPQRAAGGL